MAPGRLLLISIVWGVLAILLVAPFQAPFSKFSSERNSDDTSLLQTSFELAPQASTSSVSSLLQKDQATAISAEPAIPSYDSLALPKLPDFDKGMESVSLLGTSSATTGTDDFEPLTSDATVASRLPSLDAPMLSDAAALGKQNLDLPGLEPDPLADRLRAAADATSRGNSESYLDTAALQAEAQTWPSADSQAQHSLSEATDDHKRLSELLAQLTPGSPAAETKAVENPSAQFEVSQGELSQLEAEIRDRAAAEVRSTLEAAAEQVHHTVEKARAAILAEEQRKAQATSADSLAALQLQRMQVPAPTPSNEWRLAFTSKGNETNKNGTTQSTDGSDNCANAPGHPKCTTWNRLFTWNYRFSLVPGIILWVVFIWLCFCGAGLFGILFGFEGWIMFIIQVLCCFFLAAFIAALYIEWNH